MRNWRALPWVLICAAGLLAGSFGTADAILTLTLDDPSTVGTDVTVTDGGAGDLNGTVGVITYVGSFGSWDINVTTALSGNSPLVLPDLSMDVASVNTTLGTGDLVITAYDEFFLSAGTYTLSAELGGTSSADPFSISLTQCVDRPSAPDCILAGGVVNVGAFTTSPYSGANSSTFTLGTGATVAIVDIVTIQHGSAGQTSFDAFSEIPVPQPSALLLLGTGLLGVVAWGRLRSRRPAK